ncbi:related to putative glycosidases [Cephalotrichum gorgonifer]|uniref:chitinase n=1 Tax=Cephalotrichum gorgonifer TaxID=2041049 RepID=A0AAE8STX0_9PEZI|nr:related to putative glycosidases [Cephalotrichum gorgonifer]
MFSLRRSWLPALLLAALPLAVAQTHTDCDPTKKDCPNDPAFGTSHFFNFNSSPPIDTWEQTADGSITYDAEKGAIFKLAKQGESPTLRSKFYFFGGRTEMMMKVSTGTGIISSMMWLSDTLDEVDWEFFGTNATVAASNYYGKGNQESLNGGYHTTPFSVYEDYHNYTCIWTKDKLEWWIDGSLTRSLAAADANQTRNFPQTPMRISLGIWAGGDPRMAEGTRQWAGGTTNFDEGPFEMYVKSVLVTDGHLDSKEYVFGDRSGSWDSIEVIGGNSTAREALNKEPEKSLSDKFNDLPQGARVAIYAGSAALGAVIIFVGLFYFIRQRRRGKREAVAAAAKAEQERLELQALKSGGDRWDPSKGDYTVAEMHDDGTVREKAFDQLGPKPDNSWPDQGAAVAGGAAAVGAAAGAAAMAGGRGGGADPYGAPGPHSPGHQYGAAPQSPGHPYGAPPRSPGGYMSPQGNGPQSPVGYMGPQGGGQSQGGYMPPGPASPTYGGGFDPRAQGLPPRSGSAAPTYGGGGYDPRAQSPGVNMPPRSGSAAPQLPGYGPQGGYGGQGGHGGAHWADGNGGYR